MKRHLTKSNYKLRGLRLLPYKLFIYTTNEFLPSHLPSSSRHFGTDLWKTHWFLWPKKIISYLDISQNKRQFDRKDNIHFNTSVTMSWRKRNGGLLSSFSVRGGFLITFPRVSWVLLITFGSIARYLFMIFSKYRFIKFCKNFIQDFVPICTPIH